MSQKPITMLDNDAFTLRVARLAPPFLDKDGDRLGTDPLRQAWEETQEVFSRLHGQRLLEVMRAIFQEMPESERIWLEWEEDERSFFYLRFSNGWSIDDGEVKPDQANFTRWTNRSENCAPDWFPRDEAGKKRWQYWHQVLHQWVVDPGVDTLAQTRLVKAIPPDGACAKDLPALAQAVLGPDWLSALAHWRLHEDTQPAQGRGPKKRL